jgi:hypothetical protein
MPIAAVINFWFKIFESRYLASYREGGGRLLHTPLGSKTSSFRFGV